MSAESGWPRSRQGNLGLGEWCRAEDAERPSETDNGGLASPSCQEGGRGKNPEVEWGAAIPGTRAEDEEEVLRPAARRTEGEVSRFSVAPRGKRGVVTGDVLGCRDPPARRVIGPEGVPWGGDEMRQREPEL